MMVGPLGAAAVVATVFVVQNSTQRVETFTNGLFELRLFY